MKTFTLIFLFRIFLILFLISSIYLIYYAFTYNKILNFESKHISHIFI